ncbi:autotransporter-associated beta strand protein [Bisgaardia hudsonensis]|uniref:exo-alpha-sialidase n=1 Tax=Bisgaardia hudsonensis TaxID=109472 RepID=A0A4R2N188_9PAST|nr:exo-alpha-sialidase [Bisgaardia hudsonensis]QLB13130.1 hypothetical protein A6A11_05640 [Bisgaardia hudsonensis]TCP13299.1 autotransporter-associated beta strand protein [Bisgaardia hudsonensis]
MKNHKYIRRTVLATIIASTVSSFAISNPIFNFSSTNNQGPVDVTNQFSNNNAFNLESGSLTFTFKNNSTSGISTLLGVTNPTTTDKYVWFYTKIENGKERFGIEIKNGNALINTNNLITEPLEKTEDGYRTVTYTFDKDHNEIKIYVDGILNKTINNSKFFKDIDGLSSAYLGKLHRANNYPTNPLTGLILQSDGTPTVLTQEQILEKYYGVQVKRQEALQKKLEEERQIEAKRKQFSAFRSEKYEIFKPNQHGSKSYRIPSLFTTKKGTVIATIDKRLQHSADWGNIDTVIRRSLDGGLTWQDDQVVLDLKSQSYNTGTQSAFLIDAVVTQDKRNGRIFMLLDMFPESQGFFSATTSAADGHGYLKVGDKYYRQVTDNQNNKYTVREDGIIYDITGQPTDFRVITEGNPENHFNDLGDLYQVSSNTRHGNIFLNSQVQGNDSAPFKAYVTSYLWLLHSDDEGVTWSTPKDITPQVKADWMRFLGTGPGTGIQLKNGNLVLPVYYTNKHNKQSPALIISKDGGETWIRGESPLDAYLDQIGGSKEAYLTQTEMTESQIIELDSGKIKMFSRNHTGNVLISTSYDGGLSWKKAEAFSDPVLLDPYSQMSVIKYSKRINGKEYILFSNPHHSNARQNGTIYLGEVQEDDSINWKYSTNITTGRYSYNSLTELPNGDIGLLYEEQQGENIQYVRLNLQELLWRDNIIYRDTRNNSDNKNIDLTTPDKDITYYKIGDGEIIQVGTGVNHAKLVIEEGTVTLAQKPDEQGNKQAFSHVTINELGTLRIPEEGQIDLANVKLNGGSIDLNGRNIDISSESTNGLNLEALLGSITNENARETTLTYSINGTNNSIKNIGSETSKINLVYQPSESSANLTITGNSFINQIDVKTGSITYDEYTEHKAENILLVNQSKLKVLSGVEATIESLSLADNSSLYANITNNKISNIAVNTKGNGNIEKYGAGLLTLKGNLSHTGKTHVHEGKLELQGNVVSSPLTMESGTILAGNGSISGDTTLKENTIIQPGFTQPINGISSRSATAFRSADSLDNAFSEQTLTFNKVTNEGTKIVLRVNNTPDNMNTWEHDQVLIRGDVVSTATSIPVDVQFATNIVGNSDTNNNGKNDPDEGISLIQVLGKSTNETFTLGKQLDRYNRENSLFQYILVPFNKESSSLAQNKFGDTTKIPFFDYRLQNRLVDQDNHRAVINPKIPSYLVANIAMLNQGNSLQQQFMNNLWSRKTAGFYVDQKHSNSNYQSNLGFKQYGYDYKSSQNSTLFGGYIPLSNNTELHAGIGLSQQDVTPNAADGWSKARYKSTSFLLAARNQWDNVILNLGLGYHNHKGKLSVADNDDIARINGKQLQLLGEVGYEFQLANFIVTPIYRLTYQHLTTSTNEHLGNNWDIDFGKNKLISHRLGANFTWKNEAARFGIGAFYEDNSNNIHDILVKADQGKTFKSAKQGNAFLMQVNADFAITKQFSIGLSLDHRHAVSNAKLKQTQFGGKLEYKF